jgi:beta-mannosidase
MATIELDGLWQVKQVGTDDTFTGRVPGDVMGDLLAAGRISDPFYRDDEKHVQWVGDVDWVYWREFNVSAADLDCPLVVLHCEGLDTLATVRVNGHIVGRGDNMYRTWEFDVRSCLREGSNRIEVRFASPMKYVARRNSEQPLPGGAPAFYRRDNGGWIRKEPCNFGWDWGPRLVTCGIWRSIRIVAVEKARIGDVHVTQRHGRGRVNVGADIAVTRAAPGPLELAVTLSCEGAVVAETIAPLPRGGRARVDLPVERARLWWPNGLGAQPLYRLDVKLRDSSGNDVDAWTRRIGLRTLQLVRAKDRWGESFCFAVNGKRFFAKGANWIPADAILSRLTRADYRRLLEDSAAANMNMLRVWGGGIYEHDVFYDICDELGICVWQDFMFACATYPAADPAFLANVEAEAADNVRRIRHHACLALWCGNNELEQGAVGDKPWQMSWEDYGRLFDRLLPSVVQRLDPDTAYWPCSPHSPHGDRADHRNPRCGDAHLWDVWHGRKPFEWYRTCEHRFNSEFGFQSFPEPRTVRTYTAPADRNVTAPIMEWHQRSPIGNDAIMQYMLDWFRLPTDFDRTLWLSQILQGLAMKYAVEHWRRSMPRGMGTLYWQLNDCWPVASWASIDSLGNWKALHYMARDFFAPVLVSGVEDVSKGRVELHVTNDRLAPFVGELEWTLCTTDGAIQAADTIPVRTATGRNRRVGVVDIAKPMAAFGAENVTLWLTLRENGRSISRNTVLMSRPKRTDWLDPELSVQVEGVDSTTFRVRLGVKRPALWVWLDAGVGARYEDNFFHVRPGEVVGTTLKLPRPTAIGTFRKRLLVRSLADTYR